MDTEKLANESRTKDRMMNFSPPSCRWLDATLVVISVGAAGAGLVGLALNEIGRTEQLAIVAVSYCLAATVGFLVAWRIIGARQEVTRYIQRLCHRDVQDFLTSDPTQSWPRLADSSPWKSVSQQLRDFLRRLAEQLRDYEHARARAEVRCHQLARERQQMADILASLDEPVLAVDQFDEVVITNPSADRLFQLSESPDECRALASLVRCEELVQLLSETRCRKAPAQKTGEIELSGPDGDKKWFRVTTRDLSLSGIASGTQTGRPHGAIAVLRDFSGQKDSQRRHAEYVSAVSHEMKTPLAGIKAYIELLVDGDAEDEETREEFLNVINGQADRLQRLIDNLLNLARIEAGVVQVHKKPQPLNDVLDEALRVVQPTAEEKQIRLSDERSPMYLGVHIDRDMMLQAAINLLSNAVKYTPAGGRVSLRSRLAGENAELDVEDSGVGLSEEDCVRVFDKFYRVKSNQSMAPGTGLGLSLAKHIVEDVHCGVLTVHSRVGEGSTFRVVLPTVARQD